MSDKEYIVPCECGLVKKIQHGKHYICPLDIPTCSKIWVKELFSDRYRNLHANIEENQLSSGGLDQECPIQNTASEPELFTNTHEDGSSASVINTNQEPANYRTFRVSGCPHYKNLKIIFVFNHFHLPIDEPEDLRWNKIPPMAGDDNLNAFNFWADEDHDSDDDSDYANEFDD